MHKPSLMIIDSRMISDEGIEAMAEGIKLQGLYLGNVDAELYGQAQSDTYILYIAKKKLRKSDLKKLISD